jgi:DNA repair photolyase
MCDPYQPCERGLGLTRRCLEVILRRGFGVTVLTKSDLILRDLDLLCAINERARCVVQLTLTTFDEELCRILEPDVCTTYRRYEVLKILREHKIPTVVWMTPILPFINDTEKNLQGLLGYCFDAGVSGIITFGFGVTLRDGDRDYFYAALDRGPLCDIYPGMKSRYNAVFGGAYECQSPNSAALTAIFNAECDARGVLRNTDQVFAFLCDFPNADPTEQLTFF